MPLVLEGLRRRLGLAAVAWACASVVVAAAVLGAVFALAAAESDLRDVLDGAPLSTAVRFQMRSADGFEQLTPAEAEAAAQSGAADLRSRYFAAPVVTLLSSANISGAALAATGYVGPGASLVYKSDACAHFRILQGRCPRGPGEAIVAAQTTTLQYGYQLGRPLDVGFDDRGDRLLVNVVGLYVPRDSTEPYWGGQHYFDSAVVGEGRSMPAVFVDRPFFSRLRSDPAVRASFDRLVVTSRVRLRDLPALEHAVDGFRSWSRDHHNAFNTDTDLRAVLAQAADQRAGIATSTILVVLQLCVLGWVTLFRILQEFIGSRDAEVVLAKLRGYRVAALLRFSSAEALTVLLLAAPTGVLVGWFLARLLASTVLLPGTPVVLPLVALVAGAIAIGGGVVAVVVSATLLLRRSVGEQSRRTRHTAVPPRLLVAVEGLVVVAAAGAFVVLRVAGARQGVVTLLAPGLLIVAVGIASGRALPLLLAPAIRRTANRRRVALLLAVRQVVRRPAGRRLVSLLTVAVALAVFGVSGEAIAAQNRDARAAVEVGASSVQRLTVIAGDDPVSAVRRSDPEGRWAAGTAHWLTFGGPDLRGTLLAVDTDRLPAVTPAVDGIQDPAALARAVRGTVAPVTVSGHRISILATLSEFDGHVPTLLLELRGPDGSTLQIDLGDLQLGTHTYSASMQCNDRCTLVGLNVNASVEGHTSTGLLLLQQVLVDGRQLDAGLHTPMAWRTALPAGDAKDSIRVDAHGVADRFTLGRGGTGGVAHNGLPDPVPVITTPTAVSRAGTGSRLEVTSSDNSTAELQVAGDQTVLPGVVDYGALTDVSAFRAALPNFVAEAAWAVWLGPQAPADARQRLQRAGLVLDGPMVTLAARRASLAREGPALALLLLQVMGIAGVLCAISGVVVSIRSVLRRRSYEGAALRTVGITRRQLLRAIIIEQALLLGSAVVFGVPVGLLAIVLAMPVLQQSNTASPVPQAVFPPALPVLALVGALVALVMLAIALSARSVVAAARGSRLREGEE